MVVVEVPVVVVVPLTVILRNDIYVVMATIKIQFKNSVLMEKMSFNF
jgi:hypothetical protein